MGWECCTTHTYDTRLLNLGDNLLWLEVALCYKSLRAVDSTIPLVTLALDGDHHLAQTLTIWLQIYSCNSTGDRCVNICRHKACSLGNLLTDNNCIALLYNGGSGCADMLCKWDVHYIRQLHNLYGAALAPLLVV